MKIQTNRREFLKHTLLGVGAAAVTGCETFIRSGKLFDISLAQWSMNRQFFGGKIDALKKLMKVGLLSKLA